MAPKVTSSRTRSRRQAARRPTSSKTRPQRSRASTNSSRMTTGGQGVGSGRGASRVTQSQSGGIDPLKLIRSLLSIGSPTGLVMGLGGSTAPDYREQARQRQSTQIKQAKTSINKYNTTDPNGAVRSRLKVGEGKVGTEAQSFDRAFAAARAAGLSEFTWKGRRYTTEMA
jgi:hypothetical protein